MSKLGYTKRSRGGQYRQRSTGDDRQATAKEQTIINYLEKASQEQLIFLSKIKELDPVKYDILKKVL